MEENKENVKKEGKVSYEALEETVKKLRKINEELYKAYQEANLANTFQRLNYLFKVVELRNNGFTSKFLQSCVEEIEDIITIKEDTSEKSK